MKYSINPGPCTLMMNQYGFQGAKQISVDEFHQLIISEKYRKPVELIRKLDGDGKIKECVSAKERLNYYLVQGICSDERKLGHLTGLTGYAPFDFDHISPQQSAAILEKLRGISWVKQAHRSCRGGIHAIVAMGIIGYGQTDTRYDMEYKKRYAQIAAALSAQTGAVVDGQCKDAVRGLYVSYDPDAFLRPDEEVEPFDYPEGPSVGQIHLEEPACQGFAEISSPNMPVAEQETPISSPSPLYLQTIERFARNFLSRHVYRPNARHGFWCDWGSYLKYKGVEKALLNEYLKLMECLLQSEQLVQKDDPLLRSANEVIKAMEWGHDHAQEKVEEEGEEVSEDDLIERLPVFPDEVYQHLPQLLQDCVGWFGTPENMHSRRTRDAVLMASIVELSALTSATEVVYGHHHYSTNLAFMLLSPPGNGKSILLKPFQLVDSTDQELMSRSKSNITAYNRQLEAWSDEQRDAHSQHRKPDEAKRPADEPPAYRQMFMSSTTSKSQLLLALEANKDESLIINSSELSTLTDALGKEAGGFSDLLCKAVMNEPLDQQFKADGRPIRVKYPRLSLCLSGMVYQFHQFVPSLDDGLFSRFLYMLVPQHVQWESQRPHAGGFDLNHHFGALSEQCCDLFNYLRMSPTRVNFTDAQWDDHDLSWSRKVEELKYEGGQDRMSICTRHALFQMRIAAVFTALRKWEEFNRLGLARDKSAEVDFQQEHKVMVCSDADFQTAKQIVEILLHHSLMLSTTKVPQKVAGTRSIYAWEWVGNALEEMNHQFSSKEFVLVAEKNGRSRSQGYRSLKTLHNRGLIRLVSKKAKASIWQKAS